MSSDALGEDDLRRAQSVLGGELAFLSSIPTSKQPEEKDEDAVDYADFDELADDESLPEEEVSIRQIGQAGARNNELDDDYDEEGEQVEALIEGARVAEPGDGQEVNGLLLSSADPKQGSAVKVENSEDFDSLNMRIDPLENGLQVPPVPLMSDAEMLYSFFPSFKHHQILNFSELFASKPAEVGVQRRKILRPTLPSRLNLEVNTDDLRYFQAFTNVRPKTSLPRTIDTKQDLPEQPSSGGAKLWKTFERQDTYDTELLLASNDWESQIVWEIPDERAVKRPKLNNTHMIDETWLDEDAAFEGTLPRTSVVLDLNDPLLLVDSTVQRNTKNTKRTYGRNQIKDFGRRYNYSNDESYNMLKQKQRSKVRSTIGQLTIEHSTVALRLQSPYFKTTLSKAELRSFHRPSMSFPVNKEIRFSKAKSKKKLKDRSKDPQILLNSTRKLSLNDNTTAVLFEYSEEYPPVMSNVGMGSRVVNYYRKQYEQDTTRPKLDIGETRVLEAEDRSPFWNFGFVKNSETVPTLYNNLIRAPIFKHNVEPTDFLVVRSSNSKKQAYFLRKINHIFAVGQTFPVIEVPGPQSRKVTTATKNRLRMIVYRILHKRGNGRLLVKDVALHFPEQNDMQNRQRLKEFMEYQRSGIDINFWTLKDPLPSEDSLRSMISPETVCLIDSVQVGQRNLEDAGYGRTVDDNDDESKMSLEQKLAPWISTKNFIHGTQGKAMLELHGDGDPTGRGEGISFIKTSMKGGFRSIDPSGERFMSKAEPGRANSMGITHAYNVAQQQQAYEGSIKGIWNAQRATLSQSSTQPHVQSDRGNVDDVDSLFEAETPKSDQFASPFGAADEDDDAMSASSQGRNRIMKITRMLRDSNGNLERRTEVIADPNVIQSYQAARHNIEDSAMEYGFSPHITDQCRAEKMEPTDDAGKNVRMIRLLESELVRLNRNKERRLARKEMKSKQSENDPPLPVTVDNSGLGLGRPPKPMTSRKCAHCGQVGHIKSNRKVESYSMESNSSVRVITSSLMNTENYGFGLLYVRSFQ